MPTMHEMRYNLADTLKVASSRTRATVNAIGMRYRRNSRSAPGPLYSVSVRSLSLSFAV